MDTKSGRGSSESVWHVARRCLALINRLQQGPATKAELIAAVYQVEDRPVDPQTAGNRFEKDKERLRTRLFMPIFYDKAVNGYVLGDMERPLLNLSDANIETLALLSDTFQPDSPHAPEVHQLIDQLIDWLPPDRQKLFKWLGGQQPIADLRLRDSEEITPDVWEAVLEAWQAKQEMLFDYLSSQHEDGRLRQHHIQPWDLYFTDRGHWHVRGYCLFNDGPNGPWRPNDYINYRLSRIAPKSVEILSRKLPGVRPNGRLRDAIFELAPAVARFGVSVRKELHGEPKIIPVDESWVRVEGKTLDVFNLSRNLLYYGRNCRVLGGKELLAEMRKLARELNEIYW
ncbi:MAG: WYL domain-containing protein [Chloroflexi bacterium]|nr:WYL domain-containing protein [Chloroflexota bacterium]